jgi:hypothetical protein
MKAQLKNYNGTPTVYLDGKPSFFGCHLVGYMDPQNPTHTYFLTQLQSFFYLPDSFNKWDADERGKRGKEHFLPCIS